MLSKTIDAPKIKLIDIMATMTLVSKLDLELEYPSNQIVNSGLVRSFIEKHKNRVPPVLFVVDLIYTSGFFFLLRKDKDSYYKLVNNC